MKDDYTASCHVIDPIIIIIIITIITEHLILFPKMLANSKAHAFPLPMLPSLKTNETSTLL